MHATYYRPGRRLPRPAGRACRSTANRRGARAQKLKRFNEWREGSMLDFLEPSPRISRAASTSTRRCSPTTASGSSAPSASAWCRRKMALAWGMSGPMLRGSGIAWDLRKKQPYAAYAEVDFDIPLGVQRRLLRPLPGARRGNAPVQPHHQAVRRSGCGQPGPGDAATTTRSSPPSREEMKDDMEALIHHFKLFTEGYCVPGRRDLCRGRGAQGRVRRVPGLRRRQQAVPLQVARAGLRAPVVDGRRSCAATCCPTSSR